MLSAKNLKKSYSHLLFDNVSFTLSRGDRVGLVGLNGCGKSTLLKILAEVEDADSGSVIIENEKIGYLPQEFDLPDMMVGEYLESLLDDVYSERYKIDKILGMLGLENLDEYQMIETLSGGEMMKLYLSKLLLENSTILLLDEPTNHLDIQGILWLEEFIKRFRGAVVVISHDRSFLNAVVRKIFEIEDSSLNIFEGNYDNYILVEKPKYIEAKLLEYKLQENRRRKLEKLLERARKIKDGRRRGKAVQSAKKRMEREVLRSQIDRYKEERIKNFKIKGEVYSKRKIVSLENISFGYDEPIFEDVNFTVYGKEKIWFRGSNGIGKTTLIKVIMGELEPERGDIRWFPPIKWEYFSQDQSHLDFNMSVEDYFTEEAGIPYQNSFGVLDSFLFSKEFRNLKIGSLSPGQRARLSFAVFAQKEYDFLILDEPTNHIDIRSKEVIEDALREYEGSMLLISHDRYFTESIGYNRIITIEGKRLVEI